MSIFGEVINAEKEQADNGPEMRLKIQEFLHNRDMQKQELSMKSQEMQMDMQSKQQDFALKKQEMDMKKAAMVGDQLGDQAFMQYISGQKPGSVPPLAGAQQQQQGQQRPGMPPQPGQPPQGGAPGQPPGQPGAPQGQQPLGGQGPNVSLVPGQQPPAAPQMPQNPMVQIGQQMLKDNPALANNPAAFRKAVESAYEAQKDQIKQQQEAYQKQQESQLTAQRESQRIKEQAQADIDKAGTIEAAKKKADADEKAKDFAPKLAAAADDTVSQVDNTNSAIQQAKTQLKNPKNWLPVAGVVGDAINSVYQPGADLAETIKGVKSAVGFNQLQEMRKNSPTGAALGRVTNFEMEMLQSTLASLSTKQSPEQLTAHLNTVQKIMGGIKSKILEDKKNGLLGGSSAQPADQGAGKTVNFSDLPE